MTRLHQFVQLCEFYNYGNFSDSQKKVWIVTKHLCQNWWKCGLNCFGLESFLLQNLLVERLRWNCLSSPSQTQSPTRPPPYCPRPFPPPNLPTRCRSPLGDNLRTWRAELRGKFLWRMFFSLFFDLSLSLSISFNLL